MATKHPSITWPRRTRVSDRQQQQLGKVHNSPNPMTVPGGHVAVAASPPNDVAVTGVMLVTNLANADVDAGTSASATKRAV